MIGQRYGIGMDREGNNEVTGEGGSQWEHKKFFTCEQMEVIAV